MRRINPSNGGNRGMFRSDIDNAVRFELTILGMIGIVGSHTFTPTFLGPNRFFGWYQQRRWVFCGEMLVFVFHSFPETPLTGAPIGVVDLVVVVVPIDIFNEING